MTTRRYKKGNVVVDGYANTATNSIAVCYAQGTRIEKPADVCRRFGGTHWGPTNGRSDKTVCFVGMTLDLDKSGPVNKAALLARRYHMYVKNENTRYDHEAFYR